MFIFLLIQQILSYDFNAFVIEWKPSICKTTSCVSGYESTAFNIHGMWPTNWSGTNPAFCQSTPFSISSDTQKLLMTCWLSNSGAPSDFWNHEWSKHGTCMSPTLTCDQYFSKTANYFFSIDVQGNLEKVGIVPSNTQTYSITKALAAFQKTPLFTCQRVSTNYLLISVEICLDSNFNIINCQGTQGDCGTGFLMPVSSNLDYEVII